MPWALQRLVIGCSGEPLVESEVPKVLPVVQDESVSDCKASNPVKSKREAARVEAVS